ncbi:hypothetical protein J1N35_029081 [Gossypium stocksii]|uniref:Uncharacterized protein n=1 Tax=Gossypium stocksii TaxID=47602 RepID=A0A9D3UY38_9ROSI|nr:hypothetical protein J1N35_029081 [Gossypium stocksii]
MSYIVAQLNQLSILEDKVTQMNEFYQKQSEVNTPTEEVMYDVTEFNDKDHCIIVNQVELNYKVQQVIRIRDHDEDLNMEGVSNPIDVGVRVDVELTGDSELKSCLIECVIKPVHFLA